jgi:cytochrome c5
MKKLMSCFVVVTFTLSASAIAMTGKQIYEKTCVTCHGDDGKGKVPGAANFTDANGPLTQSDKVLMKHIINGYQSPGSPMAMPAKGGNAALTDADLQDALKYIRDTFEPKK